MKNVYNTTKITNKMKCICNFLMYRSLLNPNLVFSDKMNTNIKSVDFDREEIHNSEELFNHLKNEMAKSTYDGKAALMLSGGIDSQILASFMPKGSQTYTFKCVVQDYEVIDETPKARYFAKLNKLKNTVIEMYWEDFEKYSSILMEHKGAPIHSIEVQIYKSALKAKEDGFSKVIFGENADIIYGGMDGLLAKDWLIGDFIERYSYVAPYKVLCSPVCDYNYFCDFEKDGFIDAYGFINEYFRLEALNSYINACETAGVELIIPYATSKLVVPLDLERIRSGDTKYLVREVFKKLYPNEEMTPKIPMPRPMDIWLKDYSGPEGKAIFHDNCALNMSGDQKWMLWALEKFLNILENK